MSYTLELTPTPTLFRVILDASTFTVALGELAGIVGITPFDEPRIGTISLTICCVCFSFELENLTI
jgi:hypothetical protein